VPAPARGARPLSRQLPASCRRLACAAPARQRAWAAHTSGSRAPHGPWRTSAPLTRSSELVVSTVLTAYVLSLVQSTASPPSGPLNTALRAAQGRPLPAPEWRPCRPWADLAPTLVRRCPRAARRPLPAACARWRPHSQCSVCGLARARCHRHMGAHLRSWRTPALRLIVHAGGAWPARACGSSIRPACAYDCALA